ncbi:hypothetical protein CEXT_414421 [Caerostris extrusa]|uniref:Uncharacterized protein n=1 Tax=Caerostris extrusa TaxID=172846 RepID=A0AAV4NUU2_CAEEX|nr:hypothetical protein CEXT_414421 [Caerostris extrusa]
MRDLLLWRHFRNLSSEQDIESEIASCMKPPTTSLFVNDRRLYTRVKIVINLLIADSTASLSACLITDSNKCSQIIQISAFQKLTGP